MCSQLKQKIIILEGLDDEVLSTVTKDIFKTVSERWVIIAEKYKQTNMLDDLFLDAVFESIHVVRILDGLYTDSQIYQGT